MSSWMYTYTEFKIQLVLKINLSLYHLRLSNDTSHDFSTLFGGHYDRLEYLLL